MTSKDAKSGLIAALAICLGLHLALLVGAALRNPTYLKDARLNRNPDARHYVLLGRNLLERGVYSRMDGPPYEPDMLRTPVYPIVAGGLDLLGGAATIYLFHVALHLGLCWLVWSLALRIFGPKAAPWAALFAATDLMVAIYAYQALSEPLYLFLSVAAALAAVAAIEGLPDSGAVAERRALAAGALLGLAILTRPAGLYLPLLFCGVLAVAGWRRQGAARGVRLAAILLLPPVILAGSWMLRNQRAFGVFRLSSVDTVAAVYMAGAGAYQVEHGLPRQEAMERMARDFDLPSQLEVQNPWIGEGGAAENDARLRAALPRILARYPKSLALSTAAGLAKGSLSHATEVLSVLLGREWDPPGLGALLRLRGDALRRLAGNGAIPAGAFLWQLLHALLVLAAAAAGLWMTQRAGRPGPELILVLLLLLYAYAGMALFGVDAYYRARLPVLPWLYLLAASGTSRLWSRRS